MARKTVEWRDGYINARRLNPRIAQRALDRIAREHGALTPATVVSSARDETHPLHVLFEWRDNVAAERYREQQARQLIASLIIVEGEKRTRIYESVEIVMGERAIPQRVYVTVEAAMADPEARARLLARVLAELSALRVRYEGLSELAAVFAAIDRVAG